MSKRIAMLRTKGRAMFETAKPPGARRNWDSAVRSGRQRAADGNGSAERDRHKEARTGKRRARRRTEAHAPDRVKRRTDGRNGAGQTTCSRLESPSLKLRVIKLHTLNGIGPFETLRERPDFRVS